MPKFILRFLVILLVMPALVAYTPLNSGPGPTVEPKSQLKSPAATSQIFLPIINRQKAWMWLDLGYGNVNAFAIDPVHPGVLYAGTWGGGVLKSTDGGANWRPVRNGLGILFIQALAIDPTNPSVLYAGTYKDPLTGSYKNGIYKSVDAGKTWVHQTNGLDQNAIVYAIAVDPQNSLRVYIGARGLSNNGIAPWAGVLYKTTNGGDLWTAVPSMSNVGGIAQQDWAYSIAIDPLNPSLVLAATHEHGPYRSLDYGNTWFQVVNGIGDWSGRTVIIDPRTASPATAYYGVWHRTGIYKTTDNGESWAYSGLNGTKIAQMTLDPSNPSRLYAATTDLGVEKSIDAGSNWAATGMGPIWTSLVAVAPDNGNTLYCGTPNDGFLKSNDGGATWNLSQHGLSNAQVTSIIAYPGNGTDLFASIYGHGIFHSTDQGYTWTAFNNNLSDLNIHALIENPAHPEILYALTDSSGLYQFNLNTGAGWALINNTVLAVTNGKPAFGPDHPFTLPPNPDFEAADNPINSLNTLSGNALITLVFAPSNPQVAYLGTSGSGFYKSTDGGSTWNPTSLTGQNIWSIAVDPTNPLIVYGATDIPGSIKTSTDGGSTWSDLALPVATTTIYSLTISPANPGTLYAGTSIGFYKRAAGVWSLAGLSDTQVTVVAAHPTNPSIIFAGTTTGAFYTIDQGATWTPVTIVEGLTIQAFNFDPNDSHILFIGTSGAGALRAELP